MDYDPRSEPHNLAHDPGTSLVVPRPIGWITTLSPAGVVNLAPYSFFNIISTKPQFVMFSSSSRKHSQRNAEMSGEFVFNLATYDLRTEMNITGSDHTEELSEAEIAGLEMAPSKLVKPPRVARSPVHFECRYMKTVELVGSDGKKNRSSVVIGEVVGIHIDDALITDGMVDITKARPIARLGYMDYSVVNEVFEIMRPASPEAAVEAAKRANGS